MPAKKKEEEGKEAEEKEQREREREGEEKGSIGKHPMWVFCWDIHCELEYLHPVASDFEEPI
jgi:hypothetical protein